MNATIWKYPLERVDIQRITLPAPARILSAGLDPSGQLCVWAMVDSSPNQMLCREIRIFGTGHSIDDSLLPDFVGTVLDGPFMWHVFASIA